MTLKSYAGFPVVGRISPVDGHSHSRTTVEVNLRIRHELLDDLNARFLADHTTTTFAEFLRKVVVAGLEVLPK